MTRLIPILIVVLCIAACKKDGSSKTNLTGKWLQIEDFNGSPGACNCWTAVNEIGANRFEFKSDGTYQQTPPLYSSLYICPGDYQVINDSTLSLTHNCGGGMPLTEIIHWFSRDGNILIIGFEGSSYNYKYKFKKVRTFN
jgi:hypothetical protein